MDIYAEAIIEHDIQRKGKSGELTGFFAMHTGYGGGTGSSFLNDALRTQLTSQPTYAKDLRGSLLSALKLSQRELYKQWKSTSVMHGSHSTVIAVRDSIVYCANAGSGAAVMCRADGEFMMLSPEVPKRFDEVEDFTIKSTAFDFEDEFILVASGTFWDKFRYDQGIQMTRTALRKHRDLPYACSKLLYAATVNGVQGNCAVMIILLNAEAAFALNGSRTPGLSLSSPLDMLSETSSQGSGSTRSGMAKFTSLGGLVKKAPTVVGPKSLNRYSACTTPKST